jgi:hypothetical protein
MTDDDTRRALIEHTARTTPYSRADIERALTVVGDDPSVFALGLELSHHTRGDLTATLLALACAVDTFEGVDS